MPLANLLNIDLTGDELDQDLPITTSGSSSQVQVPCPGGVGNRVVIAQGAAAAHGVLNLVNSGTCPLAVGGFDANGRALQPHVTLGPGETLKFFVPPVGSATIAVVCFSNCNGQGSLQFDLPTPVA